MNRAINIAKYVINYANANEATISNLKLQKILYYIQAAFLVESAGKSVCFSDKIFAWLHGPVVENVYYEFSLFGGEQIPVQKNVKKIVYKDQRLQFEDVPFSTDILSNREREIVNKVLDALLGFDAWYLVNRTHEESPWEETRATNGEITPDRIYQYFCKNGNARRIYGYFNQ